MQMQSVCICIIDVRQNNMKKHKLIRIIVSLAAVSCILISSGCGNSSNPAEDEGKAGVPMIAVTIVPEQTFVEAVCGDLAEIIVMIPPGNSPENYEPSPAEMERFGRAVLYFTIGVPVEEANILPNSKDVRVVALQEEVSAEYPDRLFETGERDPHIWLSPKRVKVMIASIAREMSSVDPANREYYENNARAYIGELDELDKEILSVLEPALNRKFIVFHPAFGYLAEDYGLTMYALEHEGKESTPKHLQEMIDLAKAENIRAVFYQEEIDSSQSEAFAEEIGGKTIQLAPLAADFTENLRNMAALIAEVMQ